MNSESLGMWAKFCIHFDQKIFLEIHYMHHTFKMNLKIEKFTQYSHKGHKSFHSGYKLHGLGRAHLLSICT